MVFTWLNVAGGTSDRQYARPKVIMERVPLTTYYGNEQGMNWVYRNVRRSEALGGGRQDLTGW